MTACLVGLACGQLFAGPLSDAYGRRRPLLIGLGVHAAASVLCAIAPDPASLVTFRALQGAGGAFGLVIANACVRDRYTGAAAARVFSSLMLVSGLAPVLAPLAGAQVLRLGDWRTVFVGLALLSGVTLAACAVAFPESLPPERRGRSRGRTPPCCGAGRCSGTRPSTRWCSRRCSPTSRARRSRSSTSTACPHSSSAWSSPSTRSGSARRLR